MALRAWAIVGMLAALVLVPVRLHGQVGAAKAGVSKASTYVGSESCRSCHVEAYDGWKQTRMANVVQDPKAHPEAVLGDFTKADPLVKFALKDVAFVYGSRWKERYFTKLGDDYYVQAAQWDVAKNRWLPYHAEAGTDWWIPFYGDANHDGCTVRRLP